MQLYGEPTIGTFDNNDTRTNESFLNEPGVHRPRRLPAQVLHRDVGALGRGGVDPVTDQTLRFTIVEADQLNPGSEASDF